MTPIRFHPDALSELDASVDFYESRLKGLGIRFLSAVEVAIERISTSAQAGSPLSEEWRKRLVPGFPFKIIWILAPPEQVVAHRMGGSFEATPPFEYIERKVSQFCLRIELRDCRDCT